MELHITVVIDVSIPMASREQYKFLDLDRYNYTNTLPTDEEISAFESKQIKDYLPDFIDNQEIYDHTNVTVNIVED